jgi:hypothetical protein
MGQLAGCTLVDRSRGGNKYNADSASSLIDLQMSLTALHTNSMTDPVSVYFKANNLDELV